MKVSNLLVSNLTITEDEYNFGGSFVLSVADKSRNVSLPELESSLSEIKDYFELEESCEEIRSYIMSIIVDKAALSSRIREGESYQDDSKESRNANSLDLS